MPAEARLGNELKVQYLDTTVSPYTFKDLDAVFDFGEFGEEKPIVDISVLKSQAREYRNGLADGLEIPLQMNFISSKDTQWKFMYDLYKNDELGTFRIIEVVASPQAGFQFTSTVRGWRVSGTPGERSVATFTLKISDEVDLL